MINARIKRCLSALAVASVLGVAAQAAFAQAAPVVDICKFCTIYPDGASVCSDGPCP
jgi:hypothetical protein